MSTTLRLTLDEYDRMINQGAFVELRDKRIELINGELREMSPAGPIHEYIIEIILDWSFSNLPRDRVWFRPQNSIGIPPSASAPEPDVAWVVRKSYRRQRPMPEDVLLVIEVSDSTVEDDRLLKAPLYAEAGIVEYWLVNVPKQCVEVHRDPTGEEGYRQLESYGIDATIWPLAFPELEFPVAMLFVE